MFLLSTIASPSSQGGPGSLPYKQWGVRHPRLSTTASDTASKNVWSGCLRFESLLLALSLSISLPQVFMGCCVVVYFLYSLPNIVTA